MEKTYKYSELVCSDCGFDVRERLGSMFCDKCERYPQTILAKSEYLREFRITKRENPKNYPQM